jgi:erythromycin esterase-like protein
MVQFTSDLKKYFYPLTGAQTDFDKVMHHIADAAVILMGEATHGTHEFYKARIEITKRLIMERQCTTIAIEGDFPDVYRVNRYITHRGDDTSAMQALGDFKRFPLWMWRNEEMLSFVQWLYDYNKSQPDALRVTIYGLDMYSLYTSISCIIKTLHTINPEVAAQAQKRYACFDAYQDPQEYGYIAAQLVHAPCKDAVVAQLVALKQKELDFFKYDNLNPQEERFYLEHNALIIKNAEHYYRSLFEDNRAASWNIRDMHMMETIKAIEKYNRHAGRNHKIVVWAHNSHIGNASATQMSSYGEINVGQLVKEVYGGTAISIGFTTYTGTVSAASSWGADVEKKKIIPALPESVESFFHSVGKQAFVIIPNEDPALYAFFDHDDYLQRAIGVIYLPESERQSHYFYAQLSRQYDIVIHYDTTQAVTPLDTNALWQQGEDLPETFPFGF